MTNSGKYYTLINEFQTKRMAAYDRYDREMAELKRYEGSEYYRTESQAAADRRDGTLTELQNEYRGKIGEVLKSMREANTRREMKPPTDAELRLLQLLKMKDHLDVAELEAAARSLSGNATCLEVLGELARQNGYSKGFGHYGDSRTLGVESTANIIATIANSTEDFLRHDTKRAARIAAEYRQRNYGNVPNAPLPKRRMITSKEQCFEEMGMLNADTMETFFNTVDGTEGEHDGE